MEGKKIYSMIPKVMGDVGAIGKSGVNRDQHYNFRSIDDVYNKLQPALHKNGVFFIPQVLEATEEAGQTKSGTKNVRVKLKVKYTIYADDGSFIEAIVYGEGIDTSDKATNKALTAAFKYMLIQVFCIAVEGIDDADSDSPELTFVKEKGEVTLAPAVERKAIKIQDGKYKNQFISDIPTKELEDYIKTLDEASKASGRKHPKWFNDLKRSAGI